MATDRDSRERQIAEERKERVPICSTTLTIPRSIWDEAWLAYGKKYAGSATRSQFFRLLNEGFYAQELDDLRPGWRPVAQQIVVLTEALEFCKARADLSNCLNLKAGVGDRFTEIYDTARVALDKLKETADGKS